MQNQRLLCARTKNELESFNDEIFVIFCHGLPLPTSNQAWSLYLQGPPTVRTIVHAGNNDFFRAQPLVLVVIYQYSLFKYRRCGSSQKFNMHG